MRRARHPLPFEMWSIRPDPATDRYIITENGLTYHLTLEHTRLLKEYFRSNSINELTIENWYKELDKFTRKEVNIIGGKNQSDPDFYPDMIYD